MIIVGNGAVAVIFESFFRRREFFTANGDTVTLERLIFGGSGDDIEIYDPSAILSGSERLLAAPIIVRDYCFENFFLIRGIDAGIVNQTAQFVL